MKLTIAFFSAVALPTIFMTAWFLYGQFQVFEANDPYIWVRTGKFLSLSFIISAGFVFILGLPAYFLLRRLKFIRWWSTSVTGFALGALPMALFTWPLKYSELKTSSFVNGVQTMSDGVPTMAGWLHFLGGVSFFGALGFVVALVFWFIAPNK